MLLLLSVKCEIENKRSKFSIKYYGKPFEIPKTVKNENNAGKAW